MSITPNRREFLGVTAGALLTSGLASESALAAEVSVAELRKHVDPLSLADETALPDAENAYPLLHAAASLLTKFPSLNDALEFVSEEDCFNSDKPNDERDRRLSKWLDENARSIDLVEDAIKRGKLQFPAKRDVRDLDDSMRFAALRRFLSHCARRFAAQQELAKAIQFSCMTAHVFRLLKNGGGLKIDYLIGVAGEASSWTLLRKFTTHSQRSAQMLREMLARLPARAISFAAERRALQGEFSRFLLPILARAAKDDVAVTVQELIGWNEKMALVLSREEFEAQRGKICRMLAGHFKPYDAFDTAKRASALCARHIRDLHVPWKSKNADSDEGLRQELRFWPEELRLDMLATDGDASRISDARLAQAARELQGIANPLGKKLLLGDSESGESLTACAFSYQARYDATRLFIALRIYELEQQVLPEKLGQLVDAKILDSLPDDPFSNGPFKYSREQKVLWSVGWDGNVSPAATAEQQGTSDFDLHLWRLDAA